MLLCLAAALPAACARYRPAPISPEASAAALESRSLADPRLAAFIAAAGATPPGPDWDLGRLTLAALYFHPELDIARSELALAEADRRIAGAVPNPTVSFEELSYDASQASPSPFVVAPVVNFLIETFGKRAHRMAQAAALEDAAREDVATAAWTVRGGVRDALLMLWGTRMKQPLLQQALDDRDQLVSLLARRLALGAASAPDLALATIARDQAAADLRAAQAGSAMARARLAAAIGLPAQALDGVSLDLDPIASPDPPRPADAATLRRAALTSRDDVKAALDQYRAAEAGLALAVADQYPNITLTPGYIFDQGQNKYMLFPSAELPVFDQNQGPIAAARARRALAASRFIAVQQQILGAIDTATASYATATRTVLEAESLAAARRDQLRRTRDLFRLDQVDRPALIEAQLAGLDADRARADALIAQRQALGALEDALHHRFFAAASKLPDAATAPPRDVMPVPIPGS
jgi:outer membrane protein TolC